jgi:hypothetical protein
LGELFHLVIIVVYFFVTIKALTAKQPCSLPLPSTQNSPIIKYISIMKKFLQIFSVLLLSCISVVAIGMAQPQTARAASTECEWKINAGGSAMICGSEGEAEHRMQINNTGADGYFYVSEGGTSIVLVKSDKAANADGKILNTKYEECTGGVLNTCKKKDIEVAFNEVPRFSEPNTTGLCGPQNKLGDRCANAWANGRGGEITIDQAQADKLASASSGLVTSGPTECQKEAGPLGFFLCPIQDIITAQIAWVLDIFTKLLTVPPLKADNVPLTNAVDQIRILANSFYVIIFLIIIFANFIAIPGLDNYSVKKLLPKLITVIILTQFSFLICSVIVDIGNIAGQTIPGVIANAVTPGTTDTNTFIAEQLFNPITDIVRLIKEPTVAGAGAVTLAGVGLFAFSWLVQLLILVVSIISLFYLMFRWFGIMLLTIFSPIAFAAWVLPNTEKFAKMWITAFLKLTLMYVLVMSMLTAAALIKVVLFAAGSDGGSALGPFVAVFIPIIAIALIPKCLKVSSTMLTAAGKMVSDSRAGKAASGAAKGAVKKSGQEGKLAELKGKGFGAAGKAIGGNTGLNMEARGEQLKKAKGAKEKDTMSKLPFTRQLSEAQSGNKTARSLMDEKLGELSNKGSLSASEYAQLKTLRTVAGQSTAGFTEDINLDASGKPTNTAGAEVMGQYDNPVYNYRGGGGGGGGGATQQAATTQTSAGGTAPVTAPNPPPGGKTPPPYRGVNPKWQAAPGSHGTPSSPTPTSSSPPTPPSGKIEDKAKNIAGGQFN